MLGIEFDDRGVIAGLASAAIAFVALFAIAQAWQYRRQDNLRAEVGSHAYRAKLIKRFDCRHSDGYYLTLESLLEWADGFYGPRFSPQSFLRSLQIAYIYSVLVLLAGWVLFAQANLGSVPVFADVPHWADRLWRAALLLCAIAVMGIFLQNVDRISDRFGKILTELRDGSTQRAGLLPQAARWVRHIFPPRLVAAAAAVVGAVFVAVFVAVIVVGAVFVVVAVVVAVALFDAFVDAAAAAVFGAVFVAAAAAVAAAVVVAFDNPQFATIFIFFFLVLPYANALADYASYGITRWFLRRMQKDRPGAWGIARRLVADLCAGAACITLLLAGLVGLLELWARIYPDLLPLDWRDYWAMAWPINRDGFALWAMCCTTLLPTFVHAVWALTVWLTQKSDHTRRAVDMMRGIDQDPASTPDDALINDIARHLRKGRRNGLLRALLFSAIIIAVLLPAIYGLILLVLEVFGAV